MPSAAISTFMGLEILGRQALSLPSTKPGCAAQSGRTAGVCNEDYFPNITLIPFSTGSQQRINAGRCRKYYNGASVSLLASNSGATGLAACYFDRTGFYQSGTIASIFIVNYIDNEVAKTTTGATDDTHYDNTFQLLLDGNVAYRDANNNLSWWANGSGISKDNLFFFRFNQTTNQIIGIYSWMAPTNPLIVNHTTILWPFGGLSGVSTLGLAWMVNVMDRKITTTLESLLGLPILGRDSLSLPGTRQGCAPQSGQLNLCNQNYFPNIGLIPFSNGSQQRINAGRCRTYYHGATVSLLASTSDGSKFTGCKFTPGFFGNLFQASLFTVNYIDNEVAKTKTGATDDTHHDNTFQLLVDGKVAFRDANNNLAWANGSDIVKDNLFFFRFNPTTNQITGIYSWIAPNNPLIVNHTTNFWAFGGLSGVSTLGLAWLVVVSPGPYMQVVKTFENEAKVGQCCSTGFTDPASKQVCIDRALTGMESAGCKSYMPTFCNTNTTLVNDSCTQFCAQKSVNCDALYTNYCNNLAPEVASRDAHCGCFMPSSWMDNFNTSLNKAGLGVLAAQSTFCKYQPCSASAFVPYAIKNDRTCTSLTVCVSSLEITNNGAIGPISTQQVNACGGASSGGTPETNPSSSSTEGVINLFGVEVSVMTLAIVGGGVFLLLILVILLSSSGSKSKRVKKRQRG